MEAEASRRKLWAIAYRITGCAADADEIVQEAFARMVETQPSSDRPIEGWLVTVATRLSIDRLRRRRETPYDGPWLPSPVDLREEEGEGALEARYESRESATFAFLLAMEVLTPEQRAALVLREVFELPAREAGDVLGVTEDNVRALHHRARARLAAEREMPVLGVDARRRTEAVLSAFFACVMADDARGAMALLADDACTLNDGAGVYHAARRPVLGADRVARFWLGLLRKRGAPSAVQVRMMNGLPVIDARYDGEDRSHAPRIITGGWLDGQGRLATLFSVLAPRKLVHLA